ncbi:ATP-binding protein [Rhabdochromatium marinum]|uniref:ATP-binding protein n=1 Tax=Rhabdochromatium marinum TaxID=48729 RepID=UPI00190612F5|nr:ATP-binding protein [Rhabdochromatium marinum]MBK1650103.1 AAA family ATPase [Rhabdochromatium marinum]
MSEIRQFLQHATQLMQRVEALLPAPPEAPDFTAHSFRWRGDGRDGQLEAVRRPHRLALDDLLCIEHQRRVIEHNTRQFLAGRTANNVLLWGSRGTGKSSLIKAIFTAYAEQGLRLIEIDKDDLVALPYLIEAIDGREERFILYCDDLSFEASESSYKTLKAVLDGSISAAPDNVLIYATSNRRHLLPEFQHENQDARMIDGEIHLGDSSEEKISLSDRFGLWLSFYPFSQEQYLRVVHHWLARLSESQGSTAPLAEAETIEREALQWALTRGSRSGRTAWQFARDWAGRLHNA